MSPGDVVLAHMPPDPKLRPALYLASLPGPYQVALLSGISTKIVPLTTDWDELIQPGDTDYASSGVHRTSVIRLSYLRGVMSTEIAGLIGRIDQSRLTHLRQRLTDHLKP